MEMASIYLNVSLCDGRTRFYCLVFKCAFGCARECGECKCAGLLLCFCRSLLMLACYFNERASDSDAATKKKKQQRSSPS